MKEDKKNLLFNINKTNNEPWTNTPNQERRNANLTVNPLFRNRSERLNRAARIFADTYRSTQDF